jgi:hypothetical protein
MVILQPDDSGLPATFFGHHRGEVGIDLLVVVPVQGFEDGALEVEVAKGPQGAVGKAIVKSPQLGFTQPDTPQGILRIVRRDLHLILGVDNLSIGTPAPPGNPGAMAGLHDRIKR